MRCLKLDASSGGHMCLTVIGITNSPKMGGIRAVFLPGGHMGPPVVGITNSPKMKGNRTIFPLGGHIGQCYKLKAALPVTAELP